MHRKTTRAAANRAALQGRTLLAARALVDRMRSMYRELERLTGAPITLHRALVCIGNEPGLLASRLAANLGMQRPAVSQILKNLATRGWIERRRGDTDRRAVQIHCTAAGRKILRATAGRAVITLQRAVSNIPQARMAHLAAGLEMLVAQLPPARPADPPVRARRARAARRSPRRGSGIARYQ
jgi:DNA-binding MarR family transcriptional regulator